MNKYEYLNKMNEKNKQILNDMNSLLTTRERGSVIQ